MDSLRIIVKQGPGSLFITFTGNRDWDELKEIRSCQLKSYMKEAGVESCVPMNDAELVVRCFRLKLKALIYEIEVRGHKGPNPRR